MTDVVVVLEEKGDILFKKSPTTEVKVEWQTFSWLMTLAICDQLKEAVSCVGLESNSFCFTFRYFVFYVKFGPYVVVFDMCKKNVANISREN